MHSCDDILISIKPEHAANLLNGTKKVELRRRAIPADHGTRVWIYSKKPRGYVEALGIVEAVHRSSPCSLWRHFACRLGVSKAAFDAYFEGVGTGYAIVFKDVVRLRPVLALDEMRDQVQGFQPPQFFKRLRPGSRELAIFLSAKPPSC